MNGRWVIGVLTASMLLAAASPAAAQTRPRIAGSESSVGSAPTCVIGGVVSDCAGSAAPGIGPVLPGLVFVQPVPVQISVAGPIPIVGISGGLDEKGSVSNDVDVDRSSRSGTAAAR